MIDCKHRRCVDSCRLNDIIDSAIYTYDIYFDKYKLCRSIVENSGQIRLVALTGINYQYNGFDDTLCAQCDFSLGTLFYRILDCRAMCIQINIPASSDRRLLLSVCVGLHTSYSNGSDRQSRRIVGVQRTSALSRHRHATVNEVTKLCR